MRKFRMSWVPRGGLGFLGARGEGGKRLLGAGLAGRG